jgi:hypothetical protein
VLEPRIGVGGKIRVIPKNRLRILEYRDLDQKTGFAHESLKRIKRLHPVQVILFQERIGERGNPQVHKGMA